MVRKAKFVPAKNANLEKASSDNTSRTFFSPQTRVDPEFTIPKASPNLILSVWNHKSCLVHILWCNRYLPVSFGQISLGHLFLATESTEQA